MSASIDNPAMHDAIRRLRFFSFQEAEAFCEMQLYKLTGNETKYKQAEERYNEAFNLVLQLEANTGHRRDPNLAAWTNEHLRVINSRHAPTSHIPPGQSLF